jgi:hypothetical protein
VTRGAESCLSSTERNTLSCPKVAERPKQRVSAWQKSAWLAQSNLGEASFCTGCDFTRASTKKARTTGWGYMRQAKNSVSVYLVCFHSESDGSRANARGQFLRVEEAIKAREWPYDNGDDPSFYVARMGGPLTWGVCRQDLRNSICRGSVVVFFSFSSLGRSRFLYRLCAVSTVIDKVDVRAVYSDRRFSEFRDSYINCLIRPARSFEPYENRLSGLTEGDAARGKV